MSTHTKKNSMIIFTGGLLLLLFLSGCAQPSTPGDTNPPIGSTTGRVVFGITDAAANMGNVTELRVMMQNVQVHSESKGWIMLSQTFHSADLLLLKAQGKTELLIDTTLEAGTYDQVKFEITNVGIMDEKGEAVAVVPAETFTYNTTLNVKANEISTSTIDFKADQSLHVTTDGLYIFAPVVEHEEKESAEVSVDAENAISIEGGVVTTSETVGMDLQGNVGVGISVPVDTVINIQDGIIVIGGTDIVSGEVV